MPAYTLLVAPGKTEPTIAADIDEALLNLGTELRLSLSLTDSETATEVYVMDEWDRSPHWFSGESPVYVSSLSSEKI